MEKYYKAYDGRYKVIHETTGKAWAGTTPTYILKDILTKYGATKNSSILEVGCGEGQNALFLQKENFNVLASDVSATGIKWCKQKANENGIDENKYFVLDIVDNNYTEKFDYIYSISTLHMFVLDEDRKAFFDFMHNHLNDCGVAIITSMGNGEFERHNSDITKAFDLAEREFENTIVKVNSTTCRIVNWQQILNEAKASNLKVLDNFVSEEISGFNVSMVLILTKE